MNVLEVNHVNKHFGDKQVLHDLSFTVPEGAIFGFVGENGAGKTTTMKLILGLDTIDAGTINLFGQPVHYGETATNQAVGYLPDVPEYYNYMTAAEYLRFCGRLTAMAPDELKTRIPEMLSLVGLPNNKHRIRGFSRGMKQRLGIAQALLNRPKLLICDEPTSALDPAGRSEFLTLLASLKTQTTIIFSTHILADVERVADRVGILHHGQLQVNDTLAAIKAQYAVNQIVLSFETEAQAKQAATLIQGKQNAQRVVVTYHDDYTGTANAVLSQLLANQLVPVAMDRSEPSLEDIFLEVIA